MPLTMTVTPFTWRYQQVAAQAITDRVASWSYGGAVRPPKVLLCGPQSSEAKRQIGSSIDRWTRMAYLTYRAEVTRDESPPSGTASIEITAYIDGRPVKLLSPAALRRNSLGRLVEKL